METNLKFIDKFFSKRHCNKYSWLFLRTRTELGNTVTCAVICLIAVTVGGRRCFGNRDCNETLALLKSKFVQMVLKDTIELVAPPL
jgi:hypothetical protein